MPFDVGVHRPLPGHPQLAGVQGPPVGCVQDGPDEDGAADPVDGVGEQVVELQVAPRAHIGRTFGPDDQVGGRDLA